jgi:TIR domain
MSAASVVDNAAPVRRLVFVSHGAKDRWVAKRIAQAIEERGARTFLDTNDIEVGSDFTEVIRDHLRRADELVVLWTPWAISRPFVIAEIGAAWVRGIRIVQILYGVSASDLASNPDFPAFLKLFDMVQIDDIDTYLDQLAGRVHQGMQTERANK